MALSAAAQITTHGADSYGEFVVTSGSTLYKGALVGMVQGTGTIQGYDDAAGHIPIGYMSGPGNSVVGDGTLKAQVNLRGDVLKSQTVTGAAAATDNFAELYATDDNTFTLTRPADDAAVVGIVLFWRTGTTCDILLLNVHASVALGLAGGNKRRIHIGSVSSAALEGTSAVNLLTSYVLWGHGLIVDFIAIADGFDASYAAGTQTVNLELAGTNLTGGVLTLDATGIDSAADKALVKSATAITAANEFHDGDVMDVELVTDGTGFTAMTSPSVSYDLYIDVEYRAGA